MSVLSSKQDARRMRTVSYGTDDFDQAARGIVDSIQDGKGIIFLFAGASKEQKQEALAKVAGEDLNMYRFKVPNLIGERLVETQGNLRETFDRAGEEAAVLFFDEADVLLDPSHRQEADGKEADGEDVALSGYFFDRMTAYRGVCVVCFSSPKYAGRLEGHDVDVVVEF